MSLSHTARPTLTRERREDEPTVGWLELFYDLIFVAALIEVGDVLVTDVSWAGAGRFDQMAADLDSRPDAARA